MSSRSASRAYPIDLRVATEDDLRAVVALSRTTPWERQDFLKRQIPLGHVTVALKDGAVVGFVVWNREFFEKPFIWLVVVEESHRRQRIATTLFQAVEAGCTGNRLYTSTNRSNLAMAALLRRRGYRMVGEIDLDPGDPEVFYAKVCERARSARPATNRPSRS